MQSGVSGGAIFVGAADRVLSETAIGSSDRVLFERLPVSIDCGSGVVAAVAQTGSSGYNNVITIMKIGRS